MRSLTECDKSHFPVIDIYSHRSKPHNVLHVALPNNCYSHIIGSLRWHWTARRLRSMHSSNDAIIQNHSTHLQHFHAEPTSLRYIASKMPSFGARRTDQSRTKIGINRTCTVFHTRPEHSLCGLHSSMYRLVPLWQNKKQRKKLDGKYL